MSPPPATSSTSGHNSHPERLMSLDALRGFDMFWIIGADSLVGALRGITDDPYVAILSEQLTHREWAGFTFYDLIFPLFVFIVGVSLVYSLSRSLATVGRAATLRRVVRRSVLLYILGVVYSGGVTHEWPDIRLMGVLNRIAICYLCASLLFCYCNLRGLIIACGVLLVGYWGLMTFVPVPGVGAGSFEMGRNLANYVDAQYLPGRKYDGTWDPEGLLSTLPAIATCLLGVFAGLLLRNVSISPTKKTVWLFATGILAVVAGFAWGTQFPVIKKIWTSSYVLVAGGYSAILLALFYYVIDVLRVSRWALPFVWIGLNPITIYLVSDIVNFEELARRFVGGDVARFLDQQLTPGTGDLVAAILGLGLAITLCWYLNRKRVYLRL